MNKLAIRVLEEKPPNSIFIVCINGAVPLGERQHPSNRLPLDAANDGTRKIVLQRRGQTPRKHIVFLRSEFNRASPLLERNPTPTLRIDVEP